MAAYQAGLEMMQNGQLQGASECFDRVSKAVPLRSKLGGEAQLQRAICLDSAVSCVLLDVQQYVAMQVMFRAFNIAQSDGLRCKVLILALIGM